MGSLTLDWLHVIVLFGAIQGVFLAGALVAKRRNRTANRLLAALMLCFSIYLASAVYYAAGLELVYPQFFGFSYPLPFIFGPLVYLYAVTAADRSREPDAARRAPLRPISGGGDTGAPRLSHERTREARVITTDSGR